MNSYNNIQIKSDAEFPENVLLNITFTKLHKALHNCKQTSIGVSFPNYKVKLGDVIRLYGDEASLDALQQSNWLGGLAGYCEVGGILPVPEKVEGYRTISRVQQNMTNAKLNRLRKRGSISAEEVKKYKARMFATGLDSPYLELQSSSTGEKYRIYITFGELHEQPATGEFNYFGLSKTATIPWF
jgi:CRISPR-associated endonuclease Csy4